MIYKDEIERIRTELYQRREDLQQEYDNLPDGILKCTDSDGYRKYYQRLPAKGNRKKERRYGVKKKPDVLKGLVRKEYIESALPLIDKDIKLFDSVVKRYRTIDENSVMRDFVEEYPELESAIYRHQPDTDLWQNAFPSMEYHNPERLRAIAHDGTPTLSKNEMYIAARLEHFGLIYRHDCPTGIPGLYRFPDFQILRPRDRKVIYWEHFGMMDDIEYRIDCKRKMEEYESVGIVPWDNFMITYSKTKYDLDGVMIDAMIHAWLL